MLQRHGERDHGRDANDVPREVVGRAVPATRTGELSHKKGKLSYKRRGGELGASQEGLGGWTCHALMLSGRAVREIPHAP